jgi:hypothetical protein
VARSPREDRSHSSCGLPWQSLHRLTLAFAQETKLHAHNSRPAQLHGQAVRRALNCHSYMASLRAIGGLARASGGSSPAVASRCCRRGGFLLRESYSVRPALDVSRWHERSHMPPAVCLGPTVGIKTSRCRRHQRPLYANNVWPAVPKYTNMDTDCDHTQFQTHLSERGCARGSSLFFLFLLLFIPGGNQE